MKKRQTRKLTIHRETLQRLQTSHLAAARGGTESTLCPPPAESVDLCFETDNCGESNDGVKVCFRP